jgi:hypothetical protein
MWIRSQDRKTLEEVHKVEIRPQIENTFNGCRFTENWEVLINEHTGLGEYSSEE